jgi:hypothetical protein
LADESAFNGPAHKSFGSSHFSIAPRNGLDLAASLNYALSRIYEFDDVFMMRRNSIRGLGAWNVDASPDKTFPVTERVTMEFSVDCIEVLSHRNLPRTAMLPTGSTFSQ